MTERDMVLRFSGDENGFDFEKGAHDSNVKDVGMKGKKNKKEQKEKEGG